MSRVGQAVLINNAEESRNKGAELPALVFFFSCKSKMSRVPISLKYHINNLVGAGWHGVLQGQFHVDLVCFK